MSWLLILKGDESVLSASYFPPIKLEPDKDYYLALIGFETFNSIPNVDQSNNKFINSHKNVELPTGAYELADIESYLKKQLGSDAISLKGDNVTMHSEIKSKYQVDFTQPNTIGPMLGFSQKVLEADKKYTSESTVNILNINVIMIECNIVKGAYINGQECHTIHQFPPITPPGYRLIEVPKNVIYLPVNTKYINNITLRITDQHGQLINFRKEQITVVLHLKENGL